MTKPNKQVIIDFIISCLKAGEQRGKILAKTGKKWRTSERTFDRLLKIAKQQYSKQQAEIKEELARVDKEAAIAERKKAILTASERKELLTKIARGEIEIPTKDTKWDIKTKKFSFVEVPNFTARISAIAELNKMGGDYAAKKVQLSTKPGQPLQTENNSVVLYLPSNGRNENKSK